MPETNRWRRLELYLVVAIAAHSWAVGLALTMASGWAVRFGGWPELPDLFFVRQGGAFHLVVGTAYLYEYLRYRGVGVLVLAKAGAVAFLGASALAGGTWAVPIYGLADAAMLAAVLLVRRLAARAARARPAPAAA